MVLLVESGLFCWRLGTGRWLARDGEMGPGGPWRQAREGGAWAVDAGAGGPNGDTTRHTQHGSLGGRWRDGEMAR